jgi:hypothetical protein
MDTVTAKKIITTAFGSVQLQQTKKNPFVHYGTINGYGNSAMTAVLIASAEGGFTDFVCNQEGLEWIVAGLNAGKLGEALVVHASISIDGTISNVGVKKAKEVLDQIRDQNPS